MQGGSFLQPDGVDGALSFARHALCGVLEQLASLHAIVAQGREQCRRAHMLLQVAAVSERGRAYVWECRADAAGRVEATLRARISVGSRCVCLAVLCSPAISTIDMLFSCVIPFLMQWNSISEIKRRRRGSSCLVVCNPALLTLHSVDSCSGAQAFSGVAGGSACSRVRRVKQRCVPAFAGCLHASKPMRFLTSHAR